MIFVKPLSVASCGVDSHVVLVVRRSSALRSEIAGPIPPFSDQVVQLITHN